MPVGHGLTLVRAPGMEWFAMTTRLRPNDERMEQGGQRARLTLDITPEMRRRIRLAAAQRDLTIREYVERILDEALPPLRDLEAVEAVGRRREPISREAVERLLQARDRLTGGRTLPGDSTDLLREAREERTAEL